MRFFKLLTAFCLLSAFLTACNLPMVAPTVTPTPTAPATQTPTPTDVPTPRPDLGDPANPILLALPPSQFLDPVAVANGQTLATLIEEQTGLRVVAVAPATYSELIESLKIGNAHIAVLPPFALVRAYQQNTVQAAFASTQEEVASYGAQFVARREDFTAYYNPSDKKNTADAPDALSQFSGKKACWTEPTSPSGYLVPAGILDWYKIPTQEGAFLQSQFAVVRAVREGEICDFGGTYIDARAYPTLKDEYPFIMDEVVVVWQVPPIIPYDGIFFSSTVPADINNRLKKALEMIFISDSGKTLFDALFQIKGMIPVEDIFYVEFTRYIQSSGADLNSLVH
ncbi:MAG TPA: PhnD/SsuA/transferrin family substrate-binding protein [Anaerolineales bacterium]|nr:PhnD/SsuA/transferrin family substrate-binding protein [Anaerolineales bacterium]